MSELPMLPARRSQAIPFFAASSLQGTSLAWSRAPGRHCQSLVVKATARITSSGVTLDDEAGPLRGDEPEGRDAMGPVSYASDGVPVKACADVLVWAVAERTEADAEVAFAIEGGASLHRRLRLRGLEGRPVGRLPLSWSAAPFDPERNPAGRPVELAQITAEGSPGWAPVRLHWPCRQRHFGTYDEQWVKTRFPHYADDFDPQALQSAPDGQQVASLTGRETFRFEGLRGATHVIEGRLPGIQPQAYAMRPGSELVPVELKLDTLVFDLEAMQIDLVWRGVIDVADRRASDVAAWFTTIDGSLDELGCRQPFWALRGPVEDHEAGPRGGRDEVTPEDAEVEAARRARDRLAAAGVAPELLAHTDEIRQAAGGPLFPTDDATPSEPAEPPPPPSPRKWPAAADDPQRKAVMAWLAGDRAAPRRIVGAELSELDFSGRDLSGWSLQGCHLAGCRFDGCDLQQAELGDADATGASFVGTNLARAGLQKTRLDRVDARRAVLTDTDLSGVRAHQARFDELQGQGASFADASLREASFVGAKLDGASFEGARFERAHFSRASLREVRLYDARGEGASFAGADLTELRADTAHLLSAHFDEARADDAIFDGADLRQTHWNGATMKGASLVGCLLGGAEMGGVSAREARMSEAELSSADLSKGDWMGADFSHAVLSDVDVQGASLFGADLHGAKTDGMQTDGANLNRTILKPS